MTTKTTTPQPGKPVIAFQHYSGDSVIGKLVDGIVSAKTFGNRTQANQAASQVPNAEVVQRGRPFLVRLQAAQ